MSENAGGRSKPMHYDELFAGRFLHAGHLRGKHVTLTIRDVDREELEGERGKKTEAILAFDKTHLLLVCAKVNGFSLREMFGTNVQEWVGKRIVLYPTNKIMPMPTKKKPNGDFEDCIRVFGSPDIARDMEIVYRPPRRKPVKMTMHATGKGAPPQSTRQRDEAEADSPPPEDEDELGGRQ